MSLRMSHDRGKGVQDAPSALEFRPRLCSSEYGEGSAVLVTRGDPYWLEPVSNRISEHAWILAVGVSSVLGGGVGLFIFNAGLQSHLVDLVVERHFVVGWFEVRSLSVAELPFTSDN